LAVAVPVRAARGGAEQTMRTERPLLRPRPLGPGDLVGLVAPSSPFPRESLERGIGFLEAHGFRVRVVPEIFESHRGFLAGRDSQRARVLMEMFADPEVRAVMAIRGGYGSLRLLERLEAEGIRKGPKIFLGYSDATAILLYLLDHCGIVSFHGPLVVEMGGPAPSVTEQWLLQALTRTEPLGTVPLEEPVWIRKGCAAGPVVGGNMSVVCSSLGTPWEINTEGRLFFLEECYERPYRIDRMLTQLRLAGKLECAAGIMFGHILPAAWSPAESGPADRDTYTWEVREAIEEATRGFAGPVLVGLPVGHSGVNITLPLGVEGVLDSDQGLFALTEPALQAD